jgi:hypothetical protein
MAASRSIDGEIQSSQILWQIVLNDLKARRLRIIELCGPPWPPGVAIALIRALALCCIC